jgi:hypothetical protein
MIFYKLTELIGRARVGQRTARIQIRQNNLLGWVENLGRLGHEMDAGEYDNVSFGIRCLPGEPERVSDIVRQVLDLRLLIVVGEENSVLLAFQATDLSHEVQASAYLFHYIAH